MWGGGEETLCLLEATKSNFTDGGETDGGESHYVTTRLFQEEGKLQEGRRSTNEGK